MIFKARIDRLVTRTLSYLYRRFYIDSRRHRPLEIVYENASMQSAEFIMNNMGSAVLHDSRDSYWQYVLRQIPDHGLIMECGVFEGASINFIADFLNARGDTRIIYGFDSFEGLQEDWQGENLAAGHFDLRGQLPSVRSHVKLYKGWVQETVGPFLDEHKEHQVALLHIDTDTYTPAKYLLQAILPRLQSGSIIAFDELIGYPNWQAHEYRALIEVLAPDKYEFIAFTSRQAALRII